MSLAETIAGMMVVGLIAYALTGGADFGGGVWDLFASGPRKAEQRKLVAHAIAPVWEANHVWLIFVVVLLFSAFPPAFAAITTALHVPLTLMMLGVVARGSAFVFRQYGAQDEASERRWGLIFASASVTTPLFLGVCLASISSGKLRLDDGVPVGGFFAPWMNLLSLVTGALVVTVCAFLAATYLAVEAGTDALRDDFRRRGLWAGLCVGPLSLLAALAGFHEHLLGAAWTWPFQIVTGVVAVSALVTLHRRRYLLARALAAAQVALLFLGWALSQRPYLVAPDITLEAAAAPHASLLAVAIVSVAGGTVLIPSLYWMFRVLKRPAS